MATADRRSEVTDAHRHDASHLFFLLQQAQGADAPVGSLPAAEDPASGALDAFLREHRISAPRYVGVDSGAAHRSTTLGHRVDALAERLRRQARGAPGADPARTAAGGQPRHRSGGHHVQLRLPPLPSPPPLPLESDLEAPEKQQSVTLQRMGPDPLSVTYSSSLRPLPPDPMRRITGVGVGGGAIHHRGNRKAAARPATHKGGKAPPGAPGHVDLWRWSVRARASPSAGLVRKANKCLLTRDWKAAFTEQRFVKAMDRIEQLKSQGLWSFRQPKRVKGPVERKSHWDYVLDEMRWLQTDYREERRWKVVMAYELARQARLYHKAPTAEARAALCVKRRPPVLLDERERMELDEPEPAGPAEEPAEEPAGPAEEPAEQAPAPAAPAADESVPAVGSDMDAEGEEDAPGSPDEAPPAKSEAPAKARSSEPRGSEPPGAPHEPELTASETSAAEGAGGVRTQAPDRNATLSGKLPLALVTAVRAPIFSMDVTATNVSPWSLLSSLDPSTAAALLQVDGASDTDALESLDPNTLDFAKLFPELPHYAPPAAPDESHRSGSDRRREEGAGQPARIAHVTRLLDAKPVLVSTLDPADARANGHWTEQVDLGQALDLAERAEPAAPPAPGSVLFARRAGKPSRDPVSHAAAIPPQPPQPELRAEQLSWTASDDAFLLALAKQYHNNWSLMADVFNSTRLVLPEERRLPWDCFERVRALRAAAQEHPEAPAEAKDTDGEPQRASRTPEAGAKRPSVKAEGARKRQHRHHLLEVMRKCAKRREVAQRQAQATAQANGNKRVNLSTHDTHAQVKSIPTPTPQALSMLKAERDQAALRQIIEQQRVAQMAYQQQQQQRVQLAQAAQVQAQAQAQAQQAQTQPSPFQQQQQQQQPQQQQGGEEQRQGAALNVAGRQPSAPAMQQKPSRSPQPGTQAASPPPRTASQLGQPQAGQPAQHQTLSYLSALNSGNAAQAKQHAMLMASGAQLPFVTRGKQPFFPAEPQQGPFSPGAQQAANGMAARSPAKGHMGLPGQAETKPSGAQQPVVVAGQGSGASPALQFNRTPSTGMSARSPLGFQPGMDSGSPSNPPAALGSPGGHALSFGGGMPGMSTPAQLHAAALGQQNQMPVRQQTQGFGSPGGVPTNLHALQQQLAISLAASHLSQEQINGLAVQLYKQAQQQHQQHQQAQQPGQQAQQQPPGQQPGALHQQPGQSTPQMQLPTAQQPGGFQGGVPRFMPMQGMPGVGVGQQQGALPQAMSPRQAPGTPSSLAPGQGTPPVARSPRGS